MTVISFRRRTILAVSLVSVILGAGVLFTFLQGGPGPTGAEGNRTVGQQLEGGSVYGGETGIGDEGRTEVTHLHHLAEEMGVEVRELAGALEAVQAGQLHYGTGQSVEARTRALAEILGMEVREVDAAVAAVMGQVTDAALVERLDVAVDEGLLTEEERQSVLSALDLDLPDSRLVPQS